MSRAGDSDNLKKASTMSDSAISNTRGSSDPGRAIAGDRLTALQVLLVSLLVALAAIGCSGGEGNRQTPVATSTQPDATPVVEAQDPTAVLPQRDPQSGHGQVPEVTSTQPGAPPAGEDQTPTAALPQSDAPVSGDDQVPEVNFPQHEAPPMDYWSESFIARLTLEEGCLRAASRLLIWPNTFRFDTRDGVVRVVDATGRIAAHVGDDVRFSRTPISYEDARDRGWIHGLSEDCPGPYWMVGGEVAAVSHVGPAIPSIPEGPKVLFPQHDAPLKTDRGHSMVVKLVLDGGCLRADFPTLDVDPVSGLRQRKSLLLVWPGTFTLSTEDGVVRVVDAIGRIAAHAGDHVRIALVAVSFQQARDQGLIHGLSEDCPGPYLLAGEEVTAISLDGPGTLLLSDPELHFPLQGTGVGVFEHLGAAAIGELVLEGHCLRLKSTDRPSRLLFWPPGFTPHVYRGVIHVRNGAGRIIAQVGDRIGMGGAAAYYGNYYTDKTIGPKCPGPTWAPNHIKVLQNVDIYFPQQDGTLATDQGMERFVGKLVLERRCLKIADAIRVSDRVIMGGGRYLPIWPDNFALSLDDGVAGIIDATGRVAARVGDEVQFGAVSVSYQEGQDHGGMRGISPACSGGYWVVGEDFAAVPDSESP